MHQLYKAYNSGLSNERVTQFVIDTVAPYDHKREVVYSVALDDIQAGDVISFEGSFVTTCDVSGSTRSVAIMYISDSPSDTNGILVANGYSENQDSGITHHQRYHIDGNWTADDNYSGKYLNMVGWAAAYSGGVIKVEQGYGALSALHFRDADYVPPPPPPSPYDEQEVYFDATGGVITEIGNERIHVLDSSADFEVLTKGDLGLVERLMVGASGGSAQSGSGAGEYVHGNIELNVGVYPAVIGAKGTAGTAAQSGGTEATDGGDTTFAGETAKGGARGSRNGTKGKDGGCGSGGQASSGSVIPGGISTASDGVGNNGGQNGARTSPFPSGGGGGADEAGGVGTTSHAGKGGKGIINDITGTPVIYCCGGHGSPFLPSTTYGLPDHPAEYTCGAPVRNTNGNSPVDNTGSGASGAPNGYMGADGSDGKLVIRYRFQD